MIINIKNFLENFSYKITTTPKIIKLYKNWYTFFLDYLGIIKKREIILMLRNGLKFKVRTNSIDSAMINENWVDNIYDFDYNFVKRRMIVVDIGAHIGAFSLLAAVSGPNIYVYSYEPFIENFRLLKENIILNNFKSINAFNLAICKNRRIRKLYIDKTTATHNMFNETERCNYVKCITLKDVFHRNKIKKIDFLKIDCEGCEYEILFTTPKNYLKKIKKISLEYHKVLNYTYKDLVDFLEQIDFSVEINKIDLKKGLMYAINNNYN